MERKLRYIQREAMRDGIPLVKPGKYLGGKRSSQSLNEDSGFMIDGTI